MSDANDWDEAGAAPSKPIYKRVWFIVLMTILVLCGGGIALVVGGSFFALGAAADQVEVMLEEDPVIIEHIGADITDISMEIMKMGEYQQEMGKQVQVYSVSGANGSGMVVLDNIAFSSGRIEGTLEMSTGEEYELAGTDMTHSHDGEGEHSHEH